METAPSPPAAPPAAPVGDPWRTEVAVLRAAVRRRTFPLGAHLGVPAGARRSLELPWPPTEVDPGLRFDLLAALLGGAPEPAYLWTTRPGVPELHDVDLQWYAAGLRAAAAHGLVLRGCFAVTRTGWLDVVGGGTRCWKRLRLQR